MPDQPIVDAHVHLIDPGLLRYPWLTGAPSLNRAWRLDDFLLASQAAAVNQFVFVEADVHAGDRMAEGRWIGQLASQEPRVGGMVAALPVEQGEAIEPHLERLRGTGILSGVRRLIQNEPDPRFCLGAEFLSGVRLLGEHGIPFDICCFHHQLPYIAEMVRSCPETVFILDHLGKPAVRDGLLDPWRADLDRIAACRNVVCKISGLATEARHDDWSAEQLLPYLRHALDSFGDGRVMFGSDWPVNTLAIAYDAWLDVVGTALSAWPAEAQRRFWSGTARRVYRLDGPGR